MAEEIIKKLSETVGYKESEVEMFHAGGHRIRQVKRLSRAASKCSIQAEAVSSRHCNSGHVVGQTFNLDVDGNL